ncbi:MAG: hypothetical protein PHW24_04550 [Candidatus Moranbacteria bacterium]|nr:hypothetical protein [Candidatus Moranbacteria bacterium]
MASFKNFFESFKGEGDATKDADEYMKTWHRLHDNKKSGETPAAENVQETIEKYKNEPSDKHVAYVSIGNVNYAFIGNDFLEKSPNFSSELTALGYQKIDRGDFAAVFRQRNNMIPSKEANAPKNADGLTQN